MQRAARSRLDQQQTARELAASQPSVEKTLSQQEQYLALMAEGKVLFSAAAYDPVMSAAMSHALSTRRCQSSRPVTSASSRRTGASRPQLRAARMRRLTANARQQRARLALS